MILFQCPLSYPLKSLGKLQRRAAIWILGAFKTVPSFGLEVITGLIPIHLHLQKLSRRSQLRAHTLPTNHILRSLMDNTSNSSPLPHPLMLSFLTKQQQGLIKGHIIDIDNRFNKVFPSFDLINPEFQPGNRIINNFSNRVSFHLFSKHNNLTFKNCFQQLNTLAIESSNTPTNALVVTDASVKNNIAVSIVHIHVHDKPLIKTLHHAVNVMSSEAEFFAIRYSINQAVISHAISKIIIVTNSIHAAKKIFDPSLHMLQKQVAFILKDLKGFFNCHHEKM